ncbi:MAG TPA: DUF4910 domain-containing protein [Dissulfurispiraceae bacterium]
MTVGDLKNTSDPDKTGREMHSLVTELYPICRSITGEGFRRTMEILGSRIPLRVEGVPSGTKVFDWSVPREWNIRDACVKNSRGERVIDFRESNLHVVNYSMPVRKTVSLEELKDHLFTLPGHPDWVPYRTSYYKENWGFCLSHKRLRELEEGEYEVFIDSTLEDGFLHYGEVYLRGEEEDEILISCHACHPSLANDNLSGVSLATVLAQHLGAVSRRFSYRFLFVPGTIGAIAWLSMNEASVHRIKHGLVLAGVGGPGKITYKKSRRGDAEIDRAAAHVLGHCGGGYDITDFDPYGYDERQYCSPGFNLAVGCFSRGRYGRYPEYHTSADNLLFVRPQFLGDSFHTVLSILAVLEGNCTYVNLSPKCEPQLGKRGLFDKAGADEMALLWVLNLSDGTKSLLEIAEISGLRFDDIRSAAEVLSENNLLGKESRN